MLSPRRLAPVLIAFAIAFAPALVRAPLSAQQPGQPAPDPTAASAAAEAAELPPLSVTRHELRLEGRTVRYTATAGYLPLATEAGELKAKVFFVAYAKAGEDPAVRPVTFTFNGGPGSSSVWLHMGAGGPKRVLMGPEGEQPAPPYRLVPNEHTWLDFTDLVFIDPVTTGYSRAAAGEGATQFHGVEEDVESVAEFIRLWTTRFERWSSPKFLAGESYGTTRAAALSAPLQQRHGMYLNGIVLISAVLNFQTISFDVGNDLPFLMFLPGYTATAWYHGRLPADLQQKPLREVLDETEQFALNDYALALLQGDVLPAAERREIVERLARYTGLDAEYIERANLRVSSRRFFKELLRDQGATVGRLDSRFKGVDRDAVGERAEYDPSMEAIRGPYTALVNDYLRRELRFESDLPYEILTGRVRPWRYGPAQNQYLNVGETLRGAMARNPALQVFVASGYYDLATPYFGSVYTFRHLGLTPERRQNVTMEFYEAGHMMYIREADLAELKRDLAAFYARAHEQRVPVATRAAETAGR